MGDKNRGLYAKYNQITRTDGEDLPGKKHNDCFLFVLDVTHDPHARAALQAYVDSCRGEYPLLAQDLEIRLRDILYPNVIDVSHS